MQLIHEAIASAELIDELCDVVATEPAAGRAFEPRYVEPSDRAADRAVEGAGHFNDYRPDSVIFIPATSSDEYSIAVVQPSGQSVRTSRFAALLAANNDTGAMRKVRSLPRRIDRPNPYSPATAGTAVKVTRMRITDAGRAPRGGLSGSSRPCRI